MSSSAKVELRHQLFDSLGGITARCFDLVKGPIIPSVGDISTIAESQLFHCLGAKGGQFNTDARLFFHAFDIVTAGAAILANQRFTAFYIIGIGKFFFDTGDGFALVPNVVR